jgi:hypothetical protein
MLLAQAEAEKLFIVSKRENLRSVRGAPYLVKRRVQATARSPARFPRPLLILTSSKAYIDPGVHLSIPLEHLF